MDVRTRARNLWSGTAKSPLLRALIVLLVLALLAGVAWLAFTLVHQAPSGGAAGGGGRRGGRPSTTVGVAAATMADIPITLDALGTVRPAATVTVTPQVSGMLTQVLFREGQTVRRGQPLAIIDPRPLQMALLQAQGQLARDQAQLAGAQVLLTRQRTLLGQDSIARQDVDTQVALVRQLQGAVISDQANVGAARLNLGFSRVTAPVSGRVGLRIVDVGNYVSAGAAGGIVVITEVTPIDVEFTLPQDQAPQVQAQAAQGPLTVTAFDRTQTTILDSGTFSTLDNQIDTTTGTVRAKARFPNLTGRLFPNQFVNVRINLQTLHAVVVPVTAVRTGANGDFVWKLNNDHTVSMQAVTRGPGTPTTVAITSGLTAGERVITEGGDRLTDGARVQLPGERPQAGGGGGRRGGRHRHGGAGGQGGGQNGGGQNGGGRNGGGRNGGGQNGGAQGGGGQGGGGGPGGGDG